MRWAKLFFMSLETVAVTRGFLLKLAGLRWQNSGWTVKMYPLPFSFLFFMAVRKVLGTWDLQFGLQSKLVAVCLTDSKVEPLEHNHYKPASGAEMRCEQCTASGIALPAEMEKPLGTSSHGSSTRVGLVYWGVCSLPICVGINICTVLRTHLLFKWLCSNLLLIKMNCYLLLRQMSFKYASGLLLLQLWQNSDLSQIFLSV